MMENESLREPKNTTVMLLSLLLVAAVGWALVATVKTVNRGKDIKALAGDKEALRMELDAVRQDASVKIAEAEKMRQICAEWTRQHQLQVQEEMRKKAEAAAKAKEAATKKVTTSTKSSTGKSAKSSTPVKKSTTTTKKSAKSHS